jgi:2,3-bisphosphoglycerate-dependent phosphoglycerate mutase
LAGQHADGLLVIGSHGTFLARLLAGLGLPVDWPFCRDMPMPAIYGLRLTPTGSLATAYGPGPPNQDPVS